MTTFEYLSVFIAIVLGLAVVRLLGGLIAALTGEGVRRYWVYTAWLLFWIYWLPFFWWFTFDWRHQEIWTFPLFLFVVFYALLVYVVTAVLVPDDSSRPLDHENFFFQIRRRFFGLFAFMIIVDTLDTVLKGPANVEGLGSTYFFRAGFYFAGHVVASVTDNRRYHAAWTIIFISIWVGVGGFLTADVFGGR